MQIIDHTLTIGETTVDLPRLSMDATVHAWTVPVAYRDNGYFVSVQPTGHPMEIPACDGRDAQYLGSAPLPADPAVVAAEALAGAKAAACDRLNATRDAIEYSVYTDSHGVRYDVDAKGREKMTGVTAMLGATGVALPASFTWTDADNIERPHNAETFLGLTSEILAWTDAVHRAAVAAKAEVRTAGTLEAVQSAEAGVVWPG